MKKIFLLFVLLVTFAFSAIDECKTDVYFGNGILTKQQSAKDNARLLEDAIIEKFGLDYYKKHIGKVDYAYNSTHGTYWDMIESAAQKWGMQWLKDKLWDTVHKADLSLQIKHYKESIRLGHKVLVVAHSQGNLFANDAYKAILGDSHDWWMVSYFKIVSIASPMHFMITPDTPEISWDNDLVADLGLDLMSGRTYSPVRKIKWEFYDGVPIASRVARPRYNYVRSNKVNEIYKGSWKAVEGLLQKFDSNVHAFTFYMGKPIKDGDTREIFYNPFDENKTLQTDRAKTKIMAAIESQLKILQEKPSQWKVKRELGCVCNEKYAVMTHRFDPHGMDKLLKDQKIKNFAGDRKGKIYPVNGLYVRATCGGVKIEEVDEGDACLALESIDEARLGVIEGLKGKPDPKAGVVEVTASWSKPELDYDLIVSWDAGETDIKDTGCPMEHYYISSEKVIYPDKYPVWIVPKDPTDPVWDDPTTYPHTFSVQISTPGKGADAQWTATATIGSRAGLSQFGHLADIKVYRTDDPDKKDPDDDDDDDDDGAPENNSPIQFTPVVPPECPPVHITPPTVEPRPVYSGGGGGCGGGGWGGGGWGGGGGGGGSGTTIPIQHDPACSGDPGCLPTPDDDDNDPGSDPDTPFGTPPPEAGGTPPRDFNETGECEGDYSCYCIPCEYKVIPFLKQIYFGPLQDANYTIYSLEGYREGSAIYRGVTTHGEGLYDSGEIELPQTILQQIEDEHYYIIKASGGEDIDTDDNFAVDAAPTPNHGEIYAIAKGKEIKYVGFKINILTTVSFTLAQELIEGNATAEVIGEKLSDIASRLLRYKLYPDKTQSSITNTDILVWLPTVDQDVLLKTYAPLKHMVEKVYQGKDIYKDAYAYVYGTKDSNSTNDSNGTAQPLPPLIRSFSKHISEDAPGGTVVGQIEVLRGAEGLHFGALSGKGAEKFEVDDAGIIRLREDEALDYESKWLYILKAEAYNEQGNSGKVSVFISVDDVVDAPKYLSMDGGSIEENATAGTVVGRLYYDQGAAPIERIELSGKSKDLFEVDSDGVIRLAEGAVLDYEKVRYYGLIAQAVNSYGKSIPTILYLYVRDIPDAPKITGYKGGYIVEDATAGTYIGKITFEQGGSAIEHASLSGTGAENFSIDSNGTVRLAEGATLDYERYNLYRITATIGNSYGEDNYPIFVGVRDALDVPSFVSFEGGNVDENSPIGTWVGGASYSPGASAITSMELTGADAEYFAIDIDGNITLQKPVDFETKNNFTVYVSAGNTEGNSQRLTLHLFVNDIPERPAVLDDTVFNSVEENSSSGTHIGNVHILDEGSSPIEYYTLSGEGSDVFAVDTDGKVSVVKALDYETKPVYNLQLKAKNQAGLSREVNLIIRLENVIDTVPVLRDTILSVEENASVGTVIGRVSVVSEGDSPIRAYHLSGAGSENFTIDSNGTIRISQGADLDYERLQAYSLSLRASNGAGDSMPVSAHITIKNIPDTAPMLADGSWRIDENSPAGTMVGKVNVTSHGDSVSDSFEVSGEGCDQFTIDANGTAKVSNGANLDYESINHYQCTIKAHSTSGYSNEATYEIWIDNVADTLPVLSYAVVSSVDENETAKKIVGQVSVSGNDTPVISFKLSGAGSDKFAIDNDGTLYAKADAGFDYERESSYVIYIVATTDAGSSEPLKVTIPIGDVEENPKLSYFSANIDENATAGTVVGKVTILGHGDSPIVSMKILGEGSDNFHIDRNGTVSISNTAKLDYETKNYYYIQAVATNRNGHSSNSPYGESIQILLNNVPDEPIMVLDDSYAVDENATEGTVIGKVHITRSGDSPIDHFEVYNSYYESDHGITIDINGTMRTGKNTALDYETAPSIYIYVRAVNRNGNKSIQQRVYISVNNIPDEPILKKHQQFTVDENASIGMEIGSITVVDEGDSPIILYEINDYEKAFAVDSNGTITIKDNSKIDYEKAHREGFSIRAKNQSGKYGQWAYVQVDINNIADEPIVENNQHFEIEENATVGTVVGELNITSSGDSPIDTITIYSDDEMFSIDTNGIIYVAKKLDYEYRHKYREYVKITNKNGNPVGVEFSIDLINIPDDPVLNDYTNCRIKEHTPTGTEVCQIGIIEEGDSPIVSIDFVGNEGKKLNTPFAIDTNGTITVANSDNLDYETKKYYYLRAVATNESGLKSRLYDYNYYDDYEERGRVYITLINDPDDAPVLQRKAIYVDENISTGEKIGNILKNKGKADIIEAKIYGTTYYAYGNPPSGEPSKLFGVDLNGSISIKASLDYDKAFKPCQNNTGSQRYCEYVNIVMTNQYGTTTLYQQEIEIGNVPDAPPVLRRATFSIPEDTAAGTIVGSVEAEKEGEGNITGFSILNSEDFDIDENGTIRVAGLLDYEARATYDLNVTASNQYSTSDIVSIKIDIVDVADVVPILKSFAGNVDENISSGAAVGEMGVLHTGDSPIESIALLGDGSDEFIVDGDGVIRVSQKANIDYEAKNLYTLKAVAKNMAGYSMPADVNISINDIHRIVLFDYLGSIKENSPAGTKVGVIVMDRSEGSPTKITLTGIGNEHFSVDSNGSIRVSDDAKIDYEKQAKYLLHAEAENSFVHSSTIDVNISVENMPESPPKIGYFYKGVDENSPEETVVGNVNIESETAIHDVALKGPGSEKFVIDKNGTIRVAEGADLDYEQKNYYTLTVEARNSYAASSNSIAIYLKNVPDTPPSIDARGYLVVEDGQDSSAEPGGARVQIWSDSNVSYAVLAG